MQMYNKRGEVNSLLDPISLTVRMMWSSIVFPHLAASILPLGRPPILCLWSSDRGKTVIRP